MRLVYLDESGTSTNETVTVVAGVIVDPDKQWKAVEAYVDELIQEYVPEKDRAGFVFHATDLFHGSKIFNPRTYPPARRFEALKKLIGIPATFRLPIVFGFQDKTMLPGLFKAHPRHSKRVLAIHQALTYSYCVIAAERFMRDYAEPHELATLTVENNDSTQSAVKKIHNHLKGRQLDRVEVTHLREVGGEYLPIRNIIDCINFASKDEAILLQLADACAFMLGRILQRTDKESAKRVGARRRQR